MGLLGGGNSKTSTSNTELTVANYGDAPASTVNLSNVGNSASGGASNINIATTDYGAVEAGTNLARDALESQGGLASSIVNKTLDIASKNQVSESAQFQDTLLKIALVAAGGFALYAFAGGRK